MYKTKTRRAYGEKDGKVYGLGDTIDAAIKANMTVRDYEAALIRQHPQLTIIIMVEEK